MSDFGKSLRRIRLEKGMTQEEFAKLLGTSKQNISRYEAGEVSPKISTAQNFADTLGVSLAELNGDDKKTSIVSTEPWNPEDMGWADREDNDIQIMARGMQKLTPENRTLLLQVARKMFAKDFDEEGNKR